MKTDVLKIDHYEYGREEFQLKDPIYNLYRNREGEWEVILFSLMGKANRRVRFLKENLHNDLYVMAMARLTNKELPLMPGQEIFVKVGFDEERDEHRSDFRYVERSVLFGYTLKILETHPDRIKLTLRGETIITWSAGDYPDAELIIWKSDFRKDPQLTRDTYLSYV